MIAVTEEKPAPAVSVVWVATVVIAAASLVLVVITWSDLKSSDAVPAIAPPIAAVVYATLGALILRRVGNRMGWILLGIGLGISLLSVTSFYSIVALVTSPGSLPAATIVGAASEWIFVPIVTGLAFMLLVFPTGTLPSPRWRPVAAAFVVVTGISLLAFILGTRQVALPAPGGVTLTFSNPLDVGLGPGISAALLGTLSSLGVGCVFLYGAGLTAMAVRYRAGDAVLRQQIKWVAFAGAAAFASQIALVISLTTTGVDSGLTTAVGFVSAFASLIVIPVAIALAILRYGLYQIDVIINRTVVYGLCAAAVTALYVGVVVGIGTLIGRAGPELTIVAAVAIALLFQPLRSRAQRLANRLVYGERATPYRVLADLAEEMAGTLGVDEISDRMVSVLADGTGASRVDVWIRVGSQLRPAATWPHGAPPPGPRALDRDGELPSFDAATRAVPVRQGDELLGAIALEKPKNEPLSGTEDELLRDLASQAGLLFRNARLTAELRDTIDELRASRRRLVQAQDAERRKIERNLHDGAQQQLVALKLQLGLLARSAGDADRVEQMTGSLQTSLQDAIEELRDLARGIYPPLLADKGLPAALEAQARKAAVATRVESDGVGRYPEGVESAVYFCALEALQNVAKYADATSAVVRLAEVDGSLVFEVRDDGRGFESSAVRYGTGLQGMADRLDAIGGSLDVVSAPGKGTLVKGRIAVG
jgi:signal transduction histidine kinase